MTTDRVPVHDLVMGYLEADMGESSRFRRTEGNDGAVTLTGTCPRCLGATESTLQRGFPSVLSVVTKGVGRRIRRERAAAPRAVTMYCECGGGHERPPELRDHGCGAYWLVRA